MNCNGNCNCNCANRTLLAIVLDKSGSMDSVKDATISGFNEYIDSVKKENVGREVLVTLTTFSNEESIVYKNVPLQSVEPLTETTYVPSGGTALYDAIGRTAHTLNEDIRPGDRVLFVVLTDGQENSSRRYARDGVFNLIRGFEKKGNWTFTYLGANQDAWANSAWMGFAASNSINYNSTTVGTRSAFAAAAYSTNSYMENAGGAVVDFYGGNTHVDDLEVETTTGTNS